MGQVFAVQVFFCIERPIASVISLGHHQEKNQLLVFFCLGQNFHFLSFCLMQFLSKKKIVLGKCFVLGKKNCRCWAIFDFMDFWSLLGDFLIIDYIEFWKLLN